MLALLVGCVFILGVLAGIIFAVMTIHKKPGYTSNELDKWKQFYYLYDRWLMLRQKNKNLRTYFETNGYDTIAIYGGRELAARLMDELRDSNIKIAYIIDRRAENCGERGIMVVHPSDSLPPVDVIVVTAVYYMDEIQETMKDRVSCDIVSLEDIVKQTR